MYVLLGKLRHIYAAGDPGNYLVPDDGLKQFLTHCSKKIGDAYFRTPRNTIRAFLDLLAVIEQNPQAVWTDLVGGVSISAEANPDLVPMEIDLSLNEGDASADDKLASFKL